MLLDFIDLQSGTGAMYKRLYGAVYAAILSGVIKDGERLPSIREAAAQLSVSRTTVENAYLRLCMEGLAESLPQRGYFIRGVLPAKPVIPEEIKKYEIRYDFSGKKIDPAAADTDLWKKTVREVLRDTEELTSYGDAQGEPGLRRVLADYSYKARGVKTAPENIVIGAGVGPLLSILCGLIGNKRAVGFEGDGFEQAERVFKDHSIPCTALKSDKNGVIIKEFKEQGVNTLFLIPSQLAKISVTGLFSRRNALAEWVAARDDRIIIEDDYNGELRRSARAVCAFQSGCPDKTVYIGSFSKLLLPSVRIAYMALPGGLAEKFRRSGGVYNQTCGKIEQLALENYISSGSLEKHLRRLRKLNGVKSKLFYETAGRLFPKADITLFEPSLTAMLDLGIKTESSLLCAAAEKNGIKIIPSKRAGAVYLCLAGIAENDIPPALEALENVL